MEAPPSYDQHGFDDNPPPYEGNPNNTATNTTPTDEKRPVAAEKSHLPPPSALVLDGCEISPEDNPSRVLYKATDPPSRSDPKVFQYGVQKRDVGRVYDFRADLVGLNVEVLGYADAAPAPSSSGGGQSSRQQQQKPRASPAFRMALGEDAATYHISAVGRQRAAPMAVMPLQDESGGIAWANAEGGKLLAVESRGDGATLLPRLEIRDGGIAPHDLDLLVTCWCARIWNEKKLGDKGMSVRGASGGKGKLLDSSQEVWGKLNIEKAAQAPTIALMKKNREAASNSTLDKWVFGSWSCDGRGGGSSGGWVDGSGGGGGAS
ncbi:hypothetical protein N3K66_005447 [Trichothecium roseum]|uniref:Uncharacterized protein n=1 Tax=Trichothecium roseum TaxID=47278 RepID=A0ACC0UY06_9HYPO|nr:hypothetical protein N3K66_005447 [Trichothecium roseum]